MVFFEIHCYIIMLYILLYCVVLGKYHGMNIWSHHSTATTLSIQTCSVCVCVCAVTFKAPVLLKRLCPISVDRRAPEVKRGPPGDHPVCGPTATRLLRCKQTPLKLKPNFGASEDVITPIILWWLWAGQDRAVMCTNNNPHPWAWDVQSKKLFRHLQHFSRHHSLFAIV